MVFSIVTLYQGAGFLVEYYKQLFMSILFFAIAFSSSPCTEKV